ncbi:GCD14, tRNA(1-methyladenosine) methyltransferase methyltransferase [Pyrenophora tritici-repentis]|nr:GCD14, tRNA(1-methyladenosine) methyltransferase methyltransferase [Pyrenophora tritici-repentis]
MATIPSPFLDPGAHATANNLGILQLRRDHLIPAVLKPNADSDYAEGKVENTRFGSFPHSTLVGQPWGTQILASVVDTGSRGKSKKRKRDGKDEGEGTPATEPEVVKKDIVKAAVASSGFAHLIPPTPETWTISLPHRTQVVYTPDYSYILQRLRVRPGDHIIEAGAGSGSFTHAAVRAVYNGYPGTQAAALEVDEENAVGMPKKRKRKTRTGGVYSFEYHEPRARQLQAEISDHGLSPLVTVTHRDVYNDGFNLDDDSSAPDADAIFLDLPAPWHALKHLTRSPPSSAALKSVSSDPSTPSPASDDTQQVPTTTSTSSPQPRPFRSPLNPRNATRICTFSPCIEQVTKTVSALRTLGWLEIDMVEIAAKRLDVRRERVGLQEEGVRGGNSHPANVAEAVQRLRDVEGRAAVFHSMQREKQEEVMRKAEARKRGEAVGVDGEKNAKGEKKKKMEGAPPSKHDRMAQTKRDLENRTLFKEGKLVHRTEAELKTHTSYLVFAVLPREWSKEDEENARRKWG